MVLMGYARRRLRLHISEHDRPHTDNTKAFSVRTLVTGGLGFLGRSLCARLIDEGHELTIVDDLSSSVVDPEFFANEAEVVICDVESFAGDRQFERVFHLASPVGPVAILPHGGSLGRRIVDQTCAALDVAVSSRAGFAFVSSSEVYGGAERQQEDHSCEVPAQNSVRLEYGLGKRLAETVVENRMRDERLPFTIIRPFNISGPHQLATGGFVIPTFVNQALSGSPLTVFGEGTQRRAFGHVDDIARGIVLASNPDFANSVYNLGCPENSTSIGNLAQQIVELTDSSSPITYVDPKSIHGPRYVEACSKMPEIGNAHTDLGWIPHHDLRAILEDVIADRRAAQFPR